MYILTTDNFLDADAFVNAQRPVELWMTDSMSIIVCFALFGRPIIGNDTCLNELGIITLQIAMYKSV